MEKRLSQIYEDSCLYDSHHHHHHHHHHTSTSTSSSSSSVSLCSCSLPSLCSISSYSSSPNSTPSSSPELKSTLLEYTPHRKKSVRFSRFQKVYFTHGNEYDRTSSLGDLIDFQIL